ncbi:hypothetical protein [Pseudomonas sp. CGJS7]|uniref:hypothetical protein n=1 Tax=Pseudomonas sp. CGJS7 TaxID=3109348 RepID=UPI0030083DFD
MSPASLDSASAPPLDSERWAELVGAIAGRLAEHGSTAIHAYLDLRDRDDFDAQWTHADSALQQHKRQLDGQRIAAAQDASQQLRRAVFAAVMQASGQPELAGYLSDDAALIHENQTLHLGSDWIDGLRRCYESGQLPPASTA